MPRSSHEGGVRVVGREVFYNLSVWLTTLPLSLHACLFASLHESCRRCGATTQAFYLPNSWRMQVYTIIDEDIYGLTTIAYLEYSSVRFMHIVTLLTMKLFQWFWIVLHFFREQISPKSVVFQLSRGRKQLAPVAATANC